MGARDRGERRLDTDVVFHAGAGRARGLRDGKSFCVHVPDITLRHDADVARDYAARPSVGGEPGHDQTSRGPRREARNREPRRAPRSAERGLWIRYDGNRTGARTGSTRVELTDKQRSSKVKGQGQKSSQTSKSKMQSRRS